MTIDRRPRENSSNRNNGLTNECKHLGGPQRTGLRFTVAVPRTYDTEAVISMLKKNEAASAELEEGKDCNISTG